MSIYEGYKYVFYDSCDQRAFRHAYLASPWPMVVILFSYTYFVKVCGPKFMKNRQPFKIDKIISVYNIIQICWNIYLIKFFYEMWQIAGELEDFSVWCMPVTYSDENPISRLAFGACLGWSYNKIFDLLDTVFFILRKKNTQVSYLHLYHHMSVIFISWFNTRYGTGGNTAAAVLLNAIVHIVMYSYYQLSLMGLHEWVWWKKYLTQLQLIQFVLIIIHTSSVYFQSDCYYNKYITGLSVFEVVYIFYLFIYFYAKEYSRKKKTK